MQLHFSEADESASDQILICFLKGLLRKFERFCTLEK